MYHPATSTLLRLGLLAIDPLLPPAARTNSTVASAASTLRSHPTTDAPSLANAKAKSRPILPPVPVMMHTFPDSLPDIMALRGQASREMHRPPTVYAPRQRRTEGACAGDGA